MNWKHILTTLAATALPALAILLATHPLAWGIPVGALGVVTIAIRLQPPGASS